MTYGANKYQVSKEFANNGGEMLIKFMEEYKKAEAVLQGHQIQPLKHLAYDQ